MKKVLSRIGAFLLCGAMLTLSACSDNTVSTPDSAKDSEASSNSVSGEEISSGNEENSSDNKESENSSSPDENKPQTDFDIYLSNTVVSTGNNGFVEKADNVTYRAYFPVEQGGELEYKLYFSNTVDSTYGHKGALAYVGREGGEYKISNVTLSVGGTSPDEEITDTVNVTFGGEAEKTVTPNEAYWSDAVTINIPEDSFLVFQWTVDGEGIPANNMSNLTPSYSSENGGEFAYCDTIPLPQIIGAKREVKHKLAAIGDSITQGCQTEYMKYEYWSAKIYGNIGNDISFYNSGLGWSRSSDAATNGDWLKRTAYADTVIVAFGTNDIISGNYGGKKNSAEEIEQYLTTVITELKNAGCEVILFTAPPQDFKETNEGVRMALNARIPEMANELDIKWFDFAGILQDESNPAAAPYGAHPNGEAGTIVADKFCEQFADMFK